MKSNNEKPLISVIVPVYKVEQYLDRCVESIVNQTYKNLEIILVDDGSPDNCPAMCDNWAKKDARIKVVHKQNGGLSDARNAGMSVASGEYIAFVDSDDWVGLRFIEILYKAISKYDVRLAACEVATVHDVVNCELNCDLNIVSLDTEQAFETILYGRGVRAVAWNKLYHRSLIEKRSFPVGKLHEDEFFTFEVLCECEKIAFTDAVLYYYYQRENSIMSTISPKHLDAIEARVKRIDYFKNTYPRLYKLDKSTVCALFLNYYVLVDDLPRQFKKECQTKIKKYRRNVRFTYDEFFALTLKQKVYVLVSKRLIGIASKILKITRRGRQ